MQKKHLTKLKQFFKIKYLRKLGVKLNFLSLIKGIFQKPIPNIIFHGEIFNCLQLRMENMTNMYVYCPLLLNVPVQICHGEVRQKRSKRAKTTLTKLCIR